MKKIIFGLATVLFASWGFEAKAQCPISMPLIAGDTNYIYHNVGSTFNSGVTYNCNAEPFYIWANEPASIVTPTNDIFTPCIKTDYNLYWTNERTRATETMFEGGNNIGCIGPGGCQFPIGGTPLTATSGASVWDLYFSYLDPTLQHDMVFSKTAGAWNTTTITVQDCWTNATLPSVIATPTSWVNATAAFTVTTAANTNIGTAHYTLNPPVAGALIDLNFGYCYVDPSVLPPGAYTVTYSFSCSTCPGGTTSTFGFTIANPYNAAWTAPTNLCSNGGCVNLPPDVTGTAGGTWSGTGVAGTQFCPSTSGAGTFPVTYSVGISATCSKSQADNITVNAAPTLSMGAPSYSMCTGGNVGLSVSGANTYTWTPSTGLNNANISNPTANPGSTQVYTVTGTSAAGCVASAAVTTTVTVDTPPTITVGAPNYTMCPGGSVGISASGASTYTWSPSGSLNNANISNPTASPGGTQVYTVTGTSPAGCVASSAATTTVTVEAPPTITVGAPNYTMCPGGSVGISASGASSYTWTPGGSLNNANISNPTASPGSTQVYTVTGTSAAGCVSVSAATTTVTVNTPPTLNISTPSSTMCAGGNANLSVTGANTYTWSPGGSLNNPNSANPTATPGSTQVYTVTGTDASGCVASSAATATVNVTPLPTLTVSANPSSLCTGQTTTLSVSGATTYTWSANAGNSNATSVSITPGATDTYTVTGTQNGCTNVNTITVVVGGGAAITINSLQNSICSGQSTTLNGSGATNYTWMPGGQLTGTITVNPNISTTYTLTGNNGGCVGTQTFAVNVTATPTVSTSASAPAICSGQSTTLTGGGATNYTWMPSGVNTNTVSVSPNTTTAYTLTGESGGCTSTSIVNVNVTATPTVTSTAATGTICAGQSTTLTGGGATSYTWNPTGVMTNTVSVSPANNITYTLTGANGACLSTQTVSVNVTPLPNVVAVSSATTICSGQSALLTGSGATTYTWDANAGSATTATVSVNPANPTTYTLTGTANGCTNVAMITVGVNPTPTVMVNASAGTICQGQSATLNGNGATNYTWTPTGANTSSINVNPVLSTTYSVIGETGGCTATQTVAVNVNPSPVITGVPNLDSALCGASNGGVHAIVVNGGTPVYHYQWYNGSSAIANDTLSSLTNVGMGTYSVLVTDANGCPAIAGVNTFTVPGTPAVVAAITPPLTEGEGPLNVTFTNNTTGATTYVWNLGNGSNSTAQNPGTITYNTVGIYTITLVASNNGSCPSVTTATVIVDIPTSIVIPNVFSPNGDGINDVFFIPNTGMKNLTCDIFNRWGQKMFSITAPQQVWDGRTPNGENASEGTYFFILTALGNDGKTYNQQGTLTLVK